MKRVLALVALAGCVLSGCGTSHTTTGATTTPPRTAFPLTVSAANGSVAIPSRPQRILSLSASATSMLYAMGAGPQVAGVDVYSTDPPNAPRTKFTGFETSAESFVPEHPDLVILAFDSGGKLIPQFSALHIPALLLPPAKSIDDSYGQIRQLGLATGHFPGAVREIADIGRQLDAVARSAGDRMKGRSYYHEVDNTLYTATSKTFIGALYSRLGMVNIADSADSGGSGFPQLSAEYVVRRDPDFVFLADTTCCHESAATFAARPGFSGMQAVRLHHVVPLDDALAAQWGPRVVELLRTIVQATKS